MNFALLFLLCCSFSSYTTFFKGKEDHAVQAYYAKNYDKALQLYHDLMNQDPYNPKYNYNVGDILYRQKKYADAEQSFLRVIQRADNNVQLKEKAYFNCANCYYQQQQWQQAVDTYAQALHINKDNQNARHNLELALAQLKKQQKEEQEKQEQNCSCSDQSDNQKQNDSQKNKQNNQEQKNKEEYKQNSKSEKSQEQSDQKEQLENNFEEQNDNESQNEQNQAHNNQKSQKQNNEDDQKNNEELAENIDQDQNKFNNTQGIGQDGASAEQSSEKQDDFQDGKNQMGGYKKPELKDDLKDLYESKAYQDERLDKDNATVMKVLEELEEKIQKHVIKNKVAAQGQGLYGKKGW
ncbi:MAG: tetratricopeptide repeat protein [Candidatus Chromulinivorax sp.]